jgi:alpha-beta hydrolase superfamily lysophospholipase
VKRQWLLVCLSWVLCWPSFAGDRLRERDYATLLQSRESVWLASGEHSFLALWREAEKSGLQQAAILLHDAGEHPDSPLIHELRALLPQHGWATLALQMPLREAGATREEYYALFDEALQRITVALQHLQAQKQMQRVVLIGHGLGAMMATYAMHRQPDTAQALVTISLPLTTGTEPQALMGDFIQKLAVPFLDVYAEFDGADVVDSARDRRLLAKDNALYRQVRLDGENHAYQVDPALLGKRVYSWLATITSHEEPKRPDRE